VSLPPIPPLLALHIFLIWEGARNEPAT
jgi:hypothetical protein